MLKTVWLLKVPSPLPKNTFKVLLFVGLAVFVASFVLTVTMREYRTLSLQQRQLRPLSRDRSRRHIVSRGETLSSIAARYYHAPGDWRAIAVHNGITNPRRLAAGAVLSIPPTAEGSR